MLSPTENHSSPPSLVIYIPVSEVATTISFVFSSLYLMSFTLPIGLSQFPKESFLQFFPESTLLNKFPFVPTVNSFSLAGLLAIEYIYFENNDAVSIFFQLNPLSVLSYIPPLYVPARYFFSSTLCNDNIYGFAKPLETLFQDLPLSNDLYIPAPHVPHITVSQFSSCNKHLTCKFLIPVL